MCVCACLHACIPACVHVCMCARVYVRTLACVYVDGGLRGGEGWMGEIGGGRRLFVHASLYFWASSWGRGGWWGRVGVYEGRGPSGLTVCLFFSILLCISVHLGQITPPGQNDPRTALVCQKIWRGCRMGILKKSFFLHVHHRRIFKASEFQVENN